MIACECSSRITNSMYKVNEIGELVDEVSSFHQLHLIGFSCNQLQLMIYLEWHLNAVDQTRLKPFLFLGMENNLSIENERFATVHSWTIIKVISWFSCIIDECNMLLPTKQSHGFKRFQPFLFVVVINSVNGH